MSIVGGLDVHRNQITYDWVDHATGETARGRVSPATREMLAALEPVGPQPAVLAAAGMFGAAHLINVMFRPSVPLVAAQAVGAACFGVGCGTLRLRTGTVWPLIGLHAATDLFARIGAWPAIPILVAQDIILLGYGVLLLRTPPATTDARAPTSEGGS